MKPSNLSVAATAMAVAAGLTATSAKAQSSVIIYGKINVALELAKLEGPHGGASSVRESNYRSILGFRGEEDLGASWKALFQVEGAVSVDTGGGSIGNRDTRLGLSGPWGTAFMGDWTTPYLSATAAYDSYYPTTAGYMSIIGNGSAPNATNTSDTSSFDRRQANQVQYWSPRWRGLSTKLGYSVNEETVAATGAQPSLVSGSVTYDVGPVQLVAAHERHVEYQTAHGTDAGSKVGVQYAAGAITLAAMAEQLRYATRTGDLKRRAWYVSGVYRMGAASLRAGYSKAGDGKGTSTQTVGYFHSGAGTGSSQLTVGVDYELSRRVALYTFFSRIDNQSRAIYDFAINQIGVAPGQRPSVGAAGMRYAF